MEELLEMVFGQWLEGEDLRKGRSKYRQQSRGRKVIATLQKRGCCNLHVVSS